MGQLGTQVSAARYKRDIQALGPRSERLAQLRPVSFRYKEDPQGTRQYGLIAEEVAQVYPELVTRNAQGEIEGYGMTNWPHCYSMNCNISCRRRHASNKRRRASSRR